MDTAQSIDQSVLDGLRELQEEGQPDLLTELIDIFLDDAPRGVGAVRQAVDAQDADALSRAAHSLKSSSGNLGALRMSDLCTKLEEAGYYRKLDGSRELCAELEQEWESVRDFMASQRILS